MSVRHKLLIAVSAVLAISMSTFYWHQFRQTRRDLIARVGLSAAPLNDIVSSSLTYAMQTRDLGGLREILRNVSKQRGVRHIMIVDKDGRVQVSSDAKDIGRVIKVSEPDCQVCHRVTPEERSHTRVLTAASGERIYRNVRPIANETQCHRCHDPARKINGVLISDFSMAEVERELGDRFHTMLRSLLLSLLVTTAAIAFFANRLVIRRLRHLVRATRAIGQGNLDQHVEDRGGDELAELGASFNEMVERLKRSRAVRERKELVENVLNAVRESIIVTDAKGMVISASRGTELMFSSRSEDICGQRYAALGETRARIWQQLERGESLSVETEMTRAGGEVFPVRVQMRPLRNEQDELLGYVEVIYDLTEERARDHLLHQLAESEKLAGIGLLASGVAHEVNNPMTSIATYAEALLDRVNRMEEEKLAHLDPNRRLRDYLQVIHEEAFRCKAITQNLLDYARPRALHLRPTDLREVVESALHLEQARLEAQRVTLVVHLPTEAAEAMADPDRLRQVLLNLIKNAMDAMPQGGRLTVAIEQDGDEVAIRVSDEGCGIPAEHLSRIFDPFFSTKAEGRGTGLGLSLCQQMMQKHGGRITVESRIGVGTTFRLCLPTGSAACKDQRW